MYFCKPVKSKRASTCGLRPIPKINMIPTAIFKGFFFACYGVFSPPIVFKKYNACFSRKANIKILWRYFL